jgi:hypothetical protein
VNLAIGGAFLAYVLGHLTWAFVIRPAVRRRPLRRALAILAARDVTHFPRAESLLAEVVTAGLRRRDLARARLALGYVRARMKKYDEALGATTELVRAPSPSREGLYLHIWLLARLKRYRDVEAVYEEYGPRLSEYLDANLIVGVALLRRAREHRRNRQIDGSMACFRKLKELKVLIEEIPPDIEDEKTVLGVLALLDPNPEEARRLFEGAVAACQAAGREALHPRIGLLLCRWIERKSPVDWGAAEDSELGGLVAAVGDHEPAAVAAGLGAAGAGTAGQPEGTGEKDLRPEDRLRRNVRLWYAVSLLNTWLNQPSKSLQAALGTVAADRTVVGNGRLEELERRLAAVCQVDPAMPDPHLIRGLILYYFGGEAVRQAGTAALEQALAAGVNTPEVITLVNREKKLAEMAKDRPELLFVAIKRYLANQEIPAEARRAVLQELKTRWSRFRSLDEADLSRGLDESPMSVRSLMQASREQMDGWLKRLPPAADPDRAAKIKAQIAGLKSTADEASKMLDGMADVQGKILLILAESILPEEQEAKAGQVIEDSFRERRAVQGAIGRVASPLLATPARVVPRPRDSGPRPAAGRVACPNCKAALQVKPGAVGKQVSCPKCRTAFVVQPG